MTFGATPSTLADARIGPNVRPRPASVPAYQSPHGYLSKKVGLAGGRGLDRAGTVTSESSPRWGKLHEVDRVSDTGAPDAADAATGADATIAAIAATGADAAIAATAADAAIAATGAD